MTMLIEHIDAIARQKKRDVLFLSFGYADESDIPSVLEAYCPDSDPVRCDVMKWLEENHIQHQLCGGIADENTIGGWRGEVYLDVPNDPQDLFYRKLSDFLETSDGKPKIPGVRFFLLPLEIAMKNVHHDAPGFWDDWIKSW